MAYSEQQRAEALVALELNQGNILRTAEQLGVGEATLHRWVSESEENKTNLAQAANEKLPEVREAFIDKLIVARDNTLDQYSNQITNLKGREAAISLGILIDKVELLLGNATARTVVIGNGETVDEAIQRLNDELQSRIDSRALPEVASSDGGSGESQPTTTDGQLG